VGGRLTVRPGSGGRVEICTLSGRVLWRGEAREAAVMAPGSGVYLLRTAASRTAAVVTR